MNETTILTDEQVKLIMAKTFKAFGGSMTANMKSSGVDFEAVIRLSSLAAKCKEVREEKKISFKEVANRLKIPQYHLKAIEKPDESAILPEILEQYVMFLGIESWLEDWKKANPELANRLFEE